MGRESSEMLRKSLRVAAGLIGFCLMWPGSWAIIELTSHYSPGARVEPLFEMVVMWLMTLAIWAASISLMWIAFKKPR
jgi:hypothetical protein